MGELVERNIEDLKPGHIYTNSSDKYLYLGYEGETSLHPLIFLNFTEFRVTALSDVYSRLFTKEEAHINEFLSENPECLETLMNHDIGMDMTPERQKIINTVLKPIQREYKLKSILK